MINYYIDDFLIFRGVLFCRGWCFQHDREHVQIFLQFSSGKTYEIENAGLASPDVSSNYGATAGNCRFDFHFSLKDIPKPVELDKTAIIFMTEHDRVSVPDPISQRDSIDPFVSLKNIFWEEINKATKGKVLEIGSRARSKLTRRSMFPAQIEYTGLDIIPGDNVDVVGDAHKLSSLFKKDQFDYVFSVSTFEHLIMPWKVVMEMNKIMKKGALAMIATHQSWPLHDEPWDYFRFSAHAWKALFNKYTGFEIVTAVTGEPSITISALYKPRLSGIDYEYGALSSMCIARKTGKTGLKWNVDAQELVKNVYPA